MSSSEDTPTISYPERPTRACTSTRRRQFARNVNRPKGRGDPTLAIRDGTGRSGAPRIAARGDAPLFDLERRAVPLAQLAGERHDLGAIPELLEPFHHVG